MTTEHLRRINPQDAQLGLLDELHSPDYGKFLLESGPAYAAIDGEIVVACAGFISQTEGRTMVWAILSRMAGRSMVRLHRVVERALAMHQFRRIETFVVEGFDAGVRWVEMLGFEREGLMRAYLEDGQNAWLYARVNRCLE